MRQTVRKLAQFTTFGILGSLSFASYAQNRNSPARLADDAYGLSSEAQELGNETSAIAELIEEKARDIREDSVKANQIRNKLTELRTNLNRAYGLLDEMRSIIGTTTYNISSETAPFDLGISIDASTSAEFYEKCEAKLAGQGVLFINKLTVVVDYTERSSLNIPEGTSLNNSVQVCGYLAALAHIKHDVPAVDFSEPNPTNLVSMRLNGKTVTLKGKSIREIGRACQTTPDLGGLLYAQPLTLTVNGANVKEIRNTSSYAFTNRGQICPVVTEQVEEAARQGIFSDGY